MKPQTNTSTLSGEFAFGNGISVVHAQQLIFVLDQLWDGCLHKPEWTDVIQKLAINCTRVYDPVSLRWMFRMDRLRQLANEKRLSKNRRKFVRKLLEYGNKHPETKRILLGNNVN